MKTKQKLWNQRYADKELVWSAGPNQLFADTVGRLTPGRALDVACGEGRNAIWLATQGWDVTAVDFSEVGIDKGKQIAARRGVSVSWVTEDVSTWQPPENEYDLIAVLYLHTSPSERKLWLSNVLNSVKVSGTFILIGHDRSNIMNGVGGPQDPDLLPEISELTGAMSDFDIEIAEVVERPVEADPDHGRDLKGIALDSIILAKRHQGSS